jgi:high potential iron-sulfur protein
MRDLHESPGFSRRTVLIAAAGAAPLLALAPNGDAATKVSKEAAQYQSAPKGDQFCGDCAQFMPPTACQVVEGKISPRGWCRLWAKKAG